jgi:hypothetical protein
MILIGNSLGYELSSSNQGQDLAQVVAQDLMYPSLEMLG